MQLLYLILFSYIILGDQIQEPNNLEASKVLFVVSNAHYYGSSEIPASNHFAEIALPYDVFIQEGFEVDLVSPEGGAIPIGYINTSDSIIKQYLYDCEFMQKLQSTLKPNEVRPSQYQAIFYGGGGASMFGVANNEAIQSIAMHIYENNQGVVSAVCHGSIGIANLKKADGTYLVEGRKINGFPDLFENKEAPYFKQFQYSVEALLNKRGAQFSYSQKGWDGYYIVDNRIITGQDPSSAKTVAKQIIKALSNH